MSLENPGENSKVVPGDKTEDKSDKNPENEKASATAGAQIDKWVISSPERIRIVGCGGPGTELVKGIYENYSDKLRGIEHKSFNKPTKPDFLELKLMPDYRNIRSASIKKELEATLLQHHKDTSEHEVIEESGVVVQSRIDSEHTVKADAGTPAETVKNGTGASDVISEQRSSIFNKLKSLLGPRPREPDEKIEAQQVTKRNLPAAQDNGSGGPSRDESSEIKTKEPESNMENKEINGGKNELPAEEDDDKLVLVSGQDIRDLKVQQAITELRTELLEFYNETDLIFIVTDLKSTYGLDNSIIAAQLAKTSNIITIGLVFLPDKIDKLEEVEYGNRALHSFRLNADIIVAVPYLDKLLEGYTVLIINELLELITTSGLVNLDVADIKTVVGRGNVAMMGFGSGRGYDHNKIMEAINEALSSPLLKIDLNGVNRTLVNVTGDSSMTISEAQRAAKVILSKIQPDARLIWGAAVKPKLKGAIKVMIMAGISPKNILVNIYANS